ncbi:HAD family hydrolase [Streptomyces sp. bgisy153]|uniref:HAD family hydrolase n=1 Tax=Streptomyces sp. bgisy153 TaxID=3413793 RepID=UPI003D72535B
MTTFHTPVRMPVDAVIWDYNGVLGLQPEHAMWVGLADLAGWPVGQVPAFQAEFWRRREAYDAGELADHAFWSRLLRGGRVAPPGSALLDALRRADTGMWTRTDPAVMEVLRAVQASGTPQAVLSNAPHVLADALERTSWCSTLVAKAVFSARIGVNKPDARAYEAALVALGWPSPERILFVDDRLDNCKAAERLGMRTVHYTGDPQALVRELPDLPQLQSPAVARATA